MESVKYLLWDGSYERFGHCNQPAGSAQPVKSKTDGETAKSHQSQSQLQRKKKNRGFRLRRIEGKGNTNISASFKPPIFISVRVKEVDISFDPKERPAAIKILLEYTKDIEDVKSLLLRVYRNYDPESDTDTPPIEKLVYQEVLSVENIKKLSEEDPRKDGDVPPKHDGEYARPRHAIYKIRVWVSMDPEGFYPNLGLESQPASKPEFTPHYQVHDQSFSPDYSRDILSQNGQVNVPWDEVSHAYVRQIQEWDKLGYGQDILGINMTQANAPYLRIAMLTCKTAAKSYIDKRHFANLIREHYHDPMVDVNDMSLRVRFLGDLLQEAESRQDLRDAEVALENMGNIVLRVFLAPEWYFRLSDRPLTQIEQLEILDALDKLSKNFSKWLIIPGSIFWTPTLEKEKMLEVFNTAPIYKDGVLQVNTKHNQNDALDKKREIWGMDQVSEEDFDNIAGPAIFECDGWECAFEICRDHSQRVAIFDYISQKPVGSGVDVQIVVSNGVTLSTGTCSDAVRDGGCIVKCDGEGGNGLLVRVERSGPLDGLLDDYEKLGTEQKARDEEYQKFSAKKNATDREGIEFFEANKKRGVEVGKIERRIAGTLEHKNIKKSGPGTLFISKLIPLFDDRFAK